MMEMQTFLLVMLGFVAVRVFGSAVFLLTQNFQRSPLLMLCDMLIDIVIIAWIAWLLGASR